MGEGTRWGDWLSGSKHAGAPVPTLVIHIPAHPALLHLTMGVNHPASVTVGASCEVLTLLGHLDMGQVDG